ncbi:MAG: N-acetylmuramoyl-L-alanine amidase [Micrococcales bacterium]|nr:N-acetylmuramoyl-L-alanine amidase [Micrococcales bacterium]MCL2667605.1 N-acetylmuramoyl-L-alanine amidase [Micrococcales bacterium]
MRLTAPGRAGHRLVLVAVLVVGGGGACASAPPDGASPATTASAHTALPAAPTTAAAPQPTAAPTSAPADTPAVVPDVTIHQDMRSGFAHGPKPRQFQKYIVLHDTEGTGNPQSVISGWDNAGQFIAAHFVIGKDGSVWQTVDMDVIAHHSGFGDTGHNAAYGVPEDGRDDRRGTQPIGSWASDYGMNSYSVGIELIHVGGAGDYPKAQLEALDQVIAYIDAYYGFASPIIDHKMWRTGNSDTSKEFAGYLASYRDHRSYR